MIKLRIRILVEPDDDGFHAYCPELKGVHVYGESEQEAVENAKTAADLYIRSLIKHDDPIPLGVLEGDVSLSDWFGEFFRRFRHHNQKSYLAEVQVHANAA